LGLKPTTFWLVTWCLNNYATACPLQLMVWCEKCSKQAPCDICNQCTSCLPSSQDELAHRSSPEQVYKEAVCRDMWVDRAAASPEKARESSGNKRLMWARSCSWTCVPCASRHYCWCLRGACSPPPLQSSKSRYDWWSVGLTATVVSLWVCPLWREVGSVVCRSESAVFSRLSACTKYLNFICLTHKIVNIQYIQGFCQSRISTANYTLLIVVQVVTTV
jgi:hypothetical protein